VQWSPCCRRRARVADRVGGGGDLAELHEVAVVADLVVAELVVVAELLAVADRGGGGGDLAERAELRDVDLAALHEVARQAGADARLEGGGAAKRSAASATSPRSTTRGGERSRWR
jgi:hypothetical protein